MPGREAFTRATGIRESDWIGKYWVRWNDAVAEAGYPPNKMQSRLDDAAVMAALAGEIRRLGHFPTNAELRMRRRDDPTFPSHGAIGQRGKRADLAALVAAFCQSRAGEYDDVMAVVAPMLSGMQDDGAADSSREAELGFVYLLKLGKHYKIGRTNAFGRRERELAIQMPERATTVHVIETDDPVGIEGYWHRRFAEKRVRRDAEWFSLSSDDVKAFRRRRFQ